MLFTPDRRVIGQAPEWDAIRQRKDRWPHRGMSALTGCFRQQASKYGASGEAGPGEKQRLLLLSHG